MRKLMIGVSGVRGIVGETLTPELLTRLGEAFGTFTNGGTIVVGRDTRISGEMVKHAVLSGLLSAGCEIIDLGIVATPSAAIMIKALKADGGVVISASHNAVEWNALKFFRPDGVYLDEMQAKQLLDIYYQGDFLQVNWAGVRTVSENHTAGELHLKKVLKLVDVPGIRKRKFKVALDCCNGAGVEVGLEFLTRLGCEIHELYCKPDGLFPRSPEPIKENITELTKLVKETGCDIGFALDPDADRVAIVSDQGSFIGEECTLALSAGYILGHTPGTVVTNVSTGFMLDDVAAKFGCKVLRVPVGEVNVADRMIETGAVIGGEGNGGVICPAVNYSRDSLTGMALVLQFMLETGKTISTLADELPRYTMLKKKVDCDRITIMAVIKELIKTAKCDTIDNQDGFKLIWKDSWVHLRGSNTEPVLRIIAEARTAEKAEALIAEYSEFVSKIMAKKTN